MGSSPGFVSNRCHSSALFRLAFASAPAVPALSLATPINSLAHSPKGTRSRFTALQARLALPPSVSERFQVLFHSPHRGSFHLSLTVLVRYRSSRVFSLGGWSPLLPTGLACPVVLWISSPLLSRLSRTGLSPSPVGLSSAVPLAYLRLSAGSSTPADRSHWFGLFRFRSPLLAESFLFLRLLRCFSSPGSLGPGYVFTRP